MTPTVDRDLDTELTDLAALGRVLDQRRYTNSLHAFVQAAWAIVEPNREFVDNWHIREMCGVLEDITFGRTPRAIINVPPGTMKTLLVSVFWPCWLWARNPKLKILTASYSRDRAFDANMQARKLVRSAWFQSFWTVRLKADQDEKGRFDSVDGGWRIATSVEGEGTGLHPNFIIIDDASTATDAQSEAARKLVINWFRGTVTSRGVGIGVAVVVLGQRLHEDDLPGYLLASPGAKSWRHVCWPMRYETARPATKDAPAYVPDLLDPRTVEGELLFPAMFTEAKVAQMELDLGPYDAAGQLQQRPSPEGGGLFKREWFKFVDALPAATRKRAVRGWDTAGTQAAGDYTVGVRLSEEFEEVIEEGVRLTRSTGRLFVEDVVRDRLAPDGVDKLMRSTAELDGLRVAQREEREGGASGKAQISSRAKLMKGLDYDEVSLGTNKVIRAKPYRSQCAAGNVFLLRAEWNEEYIRELCNFPTAKHDDQVDASSCAYNSLVMEPEPTEDECTW